jgi:uncharacterized cupredoxin-like copper-binding protein
VRRGHRLPGAIVAAAVGAAVASALLAGCEAGTQPPTPPVRAGTTSSPREVNVILKDWIFLPDPINLIPGERVLLHVVNGGLEVHELVLGNQAVQDAWEIAEAAYADPPPGPTPAVSVGPDVAGVRVVVASGQRVDLAWTVPDVAAAGRLIVGCHIPGHWAKGMRAAVRLAEPAG